MHVLEHQDLVPAGCPLCIQISDREEESELFSPDHIGHATYLHKEPLGAECSAMQTTRKRYHIGCVCSNSMGKLGYLHM